MTRPSGSVGTSPYARGSSTRVRCSETSAPAVVCADTSRRMSRPVRMSPLKMRTGSPGAAVQPGGDVAYGAAGAQRLGLGDVLQVQAERRSVPEMRFEDLGEVGGGHHDVLDAGGAQPCQLVREERARPPPAPSAWACSRSAAAAGCPCPRRGGWLQSPVVCFLPGTSGQSMQDGRTPGDGATVGRPVRGFGVARPERRGNPVPNLVPRQPRFAPLAALARTRAALPESPGRTPACGFRAPCDRTRQNASLPGTPG